MKANNLYETLAIEIETIARIGYVICIGFLGSIWLGGVIWKPKKNFARVSAPASHERVPALSEMNHSKLVLVIRLSSLGDIVLSTAVLAPLRRAGFQIKYVTKKSFASILASHPEITEVYAFDKNEGEAEARRKFFAWFESQRFDLVLDLQDSWRTRRWRARLADKAEVVVSRKERLREWLILAGRLGRWLGFGRGGRAQKFWRSAVEASGGDPVPAATSLAITSAEAAKVDPLLPREDFVALLPVSAWKGKEWPYFSQLAALLARRAPVVVLGGPEDLECDAVAEAAHAVNPASCSLRGKTGLRESMAVLARARWVIGNDTGMVHVAEALGKDVAMVEGPTHESMGFSPYRAGSVLLGLPLLCRPCSKTGRICFRFGSRKCLRALSVDEVALRLRERGYPC